jgi:adenine-specific DNA-methyltransferase
MAILNSKVIWYWLKNKGKLQGKLLQIDREPLLKIPIYNAEKEKQKEIINLVDKIINFKKEIINISKNSDKYFELNNKIIEIEKQIDQNVYKIYGLTEEEINIAEN